MDIELFSRDTAEMELKQQVPVFCPYEQDHFLSQVHCNYMESGHQIASRVYMYFTVL